MSDYRLEKAKLARRCTQSLRELLLGYRSLLADALRDEGLTLPQLKLLNAIQEQAGVSGAGIARVCHVTPQTLQAMLTRAERENWITRDMSKLNHRILTASLTKKGEAALARGLAVAAEIEEKIWSGVSTNALDRLNATLEHGVANLYGEINSQRPAS
ncbi:MAG TPA: MarR family transcriptional regulator [Acidobacteriaceae bacterium]|nr:MarR family transcriptional regulator [Acidobacteriaceae bacterium]